MISAKILQLLLGTSNVVEQLRAGKSPRQCPQHALWPPLSSKSRHNVRATYSSMKFRLDLHPCLQHSASWHA